MAFQCRSNRAYQGITLRDVNTTVRSYSFNNTLKSNGLIYLYILKTTEIVFTIFPA